MTKPKLKVVPEPGDPQTAARRRVAECLEKELSEMRKRGPIRCSSFSYERTMTAAQKAMVADSTAYFAGLHDRQLQRMVARIREYSS